MIQAPHGIKVQRHPLFAIERDDHRRAKAGGRHDGQRELGVVTEKRGHREIKATPAASGEGPAWHARLFFRVYQTYWRRRACGWLLSVSSSLERPYAAPVVGRQAHPYTITLV